MTKQRIFSLSVAIVAVTSAVTPSSAYDVNSVSDGGSIDGVVVYRGAVAMKRIIPTKDTQVCGAPREEPLIRVGDGQGVESAVVYLTDVSAGKEWPAAEKAPELDNTECRFEPQVQVIPAGPLVVVNSDPVLHNTHGYYGRRTAFNMALPNKDQRIETDLSRTGTVRVDCDAHGWMEGWIYVVDNPYYAVTGSDGKFSITDIPPGDYKLVAVQPHTGPIEMSVKVEARKATSLEIELKKQ